MAEKTLQSEMTSPAPPSREQVWRPRVDAECINTNPFEDFDYRGSRSELSGASIDRPVIIRDPARDTAPLQGSKDLSDDDYLGDGI